jgi:CRISPR/Cas system-associated protein Cas10 (large subunit of type III CRISPR-Cas system)
MSYKISWPALLQKAEEEVSKAEEYYGRDTPMTEIEKVRGTEMAYYEKAEDALRRAEECLTPNSKVSPTEPIEVSRSEDEEADYPCPVCGRKLPSDPEERTHHVSQHQAETGDFATKRTPFTAPEDIPEYKGEEEEAPLDAKMVKDVLNNALLNATNLVQGIENYLDAIEDLDYEDIDNAVEVVNQILQSLKDAQAMGFSAPEEAVEAPPEESIHLGSPRDVFRAVTSPTPSHPTELPDKGEA